MAEENEIGQLDRDSRSENISLQIKHLENATELLIKHLDKALGQCDCIMHLDNATDLSTCTQCDCINHLDDATELLLSTWTMRLNDIKHLDNATDLNACKIKLHKNDKYTCQSNSSAQVIKKH